MMRPHAAGRERQLQTLILAHEYPDYCNERHADYVARWNARPHHTWIELLGEDLARWRDRPRQRNRTMQRWLHRAGAALFGATVAVTAALLLVGCYPVATATGLSASLLLLLAAGRD
jgi:hypothetical protein